MLHSGALPNLSHLLLLSLSLLHHQSWDWDWDWAWAFAWAGFKQTFAPHTHMTVTVWLRDCSCVVLRVWGVSWCSYTYMRVCMVWGVLCVMHDYIGGLSRLSRILHNLTNNLEFGIRLQAIFMLFAKCAMVQTQACYLCCRTSSKLPRWFVAVVVAVELLAFSCCCCCNIVLCYFSWVVVRAPLLC